VLKLMIDRLVCADGGNPDQTTTHGKKVEEAKALELAGWSYPRHLAGRVFAVVVHGDTVGAETLRRSLSDWLTDMKLLPAVRQGGIDRYIGYYEPYATSHDALDKDTDLQLEVRNSTKALVEAVGLSRAGRFPDVEADIDPRPK
jgi:multimeric flavodoxin WrbA